MGCFKLRRENWKYLQFEDVFVDVSKRGKKIPKSDYLSEGRFPIIDQGQNYVAGYSNSSEKLYSDVPALIFGDHTRIIKYVDEPFFLGADGVKLLKSKLSDVDYKFLYYVLSQLHIIDTGYNRHFKYLKEQIIPLPPLDEQKRIADVLDKASELIKKRKEQIRLMDELAKSLFIEMFGDPVENPMGWNVKTVANVCNKIVGGGTPSKSHPEYFIGDIPWISPKDMKKLIISDSIDHINQNAVENSSTTLVPPESVLMVIRSGILKHTLPVAMSSKVVALNQDMKAFTTNELATPWYLLYFFKAIEPQLLSHVRAVTADNIEYSIIKNHKIPVPPLSLQNEFADRITAIEQQKALLQNGLAKMETAYKALMQEYFG